MALDIIVRGGPDTGKTTAASLIKAHLEELGYADVQFADAPPLPEDQKPDFEVRFARNRAQPVRLRVEVTEAAVPSAAPPSPSPAPTTKTIHKAALVYLDGSEEVLAGEAARALNRPHREPLPIEREGKTGKFCFKENTSDEVRGYIIANLYEDGRLGEIFVTLDRAGTTLRGFAEALALATSMRLQRGESLEAIASKYIGTRFEPSGYTGNKLVPRASSVIDFMFRWLMVRFVPERYVTIYGGQPVVEEALPDAEVKP